MKIYVTSVFVDNQSKALEFYTKTLGFIIKHDLPLGENRWLTVVPNEAPDGTELLLEPSDHPAVKPYKNALVEDGIPAASFQVDDLDTEYDGVTARTAASDPDLRQGHKGRSCYEDRGSGFPSRPGA